MNSLARRLESHAGLVIAALTLLYIAMIAAPMRKILWHDELFTFYIAQSPSFSKFYDAVQHVDWQPMLIFATTWLSQQIFGVNEFATRLPSVLAFYGASVGLLLVLKRHIGILWATLPVLLFWFSFYFKYSTEARPYGLLIGFFVLSLFSYDRLIDPAFAHHRNRYLAGLLIGNACMMFSHVLAPFSMMPFGAAELVRTWQRRKVDLLSWFAIVAPLGLTRLFVSNVKGFEQSYFPLAFQASFRKIIVFYGKSYALIWPLIVAGVMAALAAMRLNRQPRSNSGFSNRYLPHAAFALALLSPPILINGLMMRSHGAFWDRYCITTVMLLYVLFTLALAWFSNFNRTAALIIASAILLTGATKTALEYRPAPPMHTIQAIRSDLPMVDASGLAFLEMDHYEDARFLQRLYYLTDRASAIKYVHATLFEGFGGLNQYFPLRATVLPYAAFIEQHKHFMLFGTQGAAEDWIFQKLKADGASIRKTQSIQTPYRDTEVFEVTIPR